MTRDGAPSRITAPNIPLSQAQEFWGNPSVRANSTSPPDRRRPTKMSLTSSGTSPAAKTASTGMVVVSPTTRSSGGICVSPQGVQARELPYEVSVDQQGVKARYKHPYAAGQQADRRDGAGDEGGHQEHQQVRLDVRADESDYHTRLERPGDPACSHIRPGDRGRRQAQHRGVGDHHQPADDERCHRKPDEQPPQAALARLADDD